MTDADDPGPHRHRRFVARPAPVVSAAPPTDDLPVLTQIVAPENVTPAANAIDQAALRAAIQKLLQASLCRWLDEVLPQVIEKLENGTRQKL